MMQSSPAPLHLTMSIVLSLCIASGASASNGIKLTASDAAGNDRFGDTVAIDGDTAIVGADFGGGAGGSNQGSVYVFTRSGSLWTEQAELSASDGANLDFFGSSLAIDGDTVIVGAPLDNDAGMFTGSAYIFTRSGSTWTEQVKLTASDAATDDQFGYSVAIAGDTAIVGAARDDGDQGSVYVFTRNGATWTEQVKLTASDAEVGDRFGVSVAFNDNTALIGAVGDENSQGSAYVFTRFGMIWTEQSKLTAADGFADDRFGESVALDGDTAIIGAQDDHFAGGVNLGSAYVFTRSGSNWSQQAKLTASDAGEFDRFGISVALDGDAAIVGASLANDDQGSAYVFKRSGSTWTEHAILAAVDGADFDAFGIAVAVEVDTVIIGAGGDDDAGNSSGSAHIIEHILGRPADLNGDNLVNGADLAIMLASWGSPFGDIDDDGTTDGFDLAALLAAWEPCS